MKLVSWNVNGLRAIWKAGFLAWLREEQPDVVCLQEIKATPDVFAGRIPKEYAAWWNPATRPGYSGTLVLSRVEPLAVTTGVGEPEGDAEGRVQTVEFPGFHLVNCYTVNAKRDLSRLGYRVGTWDVAFRRHLQALDATKPVVFCGDLNVAHEEIDLANPRGNRGNSGFTDEERASFSALLAAGFKDTFRELHPEARGAYSWWSYLGSARAKNVGWRIDYFGVSSRLLPRVREAFIRPAVKGSDHCPVGIVLDPP